MSLFRRKPPNGIAHARRERQAAEQRLEHAQEHVIIPLRELRDRNHVGEVIEALIQRRVEREGGGR